MAHGRLAVTVYSWPEHAPELMEREVCIVNSDNPEILKKAALRQIPADHLVEFGPIGEPWGPIR